MEYIRWGVSADEVKSTMDDENLLTIKIYGVWLGHFGSRFPPSPCALVSEVLRQNCRPESDGDSTESEELLLKKRRRSPSLSSSGSSSGGSVPESR